MSSFVAVPRIKFAYGEEEPLNDLVFGAKKKGLLFLHLRPATRQVKAGLATEDEMSEGVPRPPDEAAQIVLKGNVVSL